MKTKLETEHKIAIDGKIEILSVGGMSREEIAEEYGAEVLRIYQQGVHTVAEYENEELCGLQVVEKTGWQHGVGKGIMTPEGYEKIDSLLRESAARLRETVEKVQNNTTVYKTTY